MQDPIRILVKRDELTLEGIKQFFVAVEKEVCHAHVDPLKRLSLIIVWCGVVWYGHHHGHTCIGLEIRYIM
jgi:hypothetical protein